MEMPRSISPALRKFILDGREEVWRAWFSNDQAKLAMLIPKEAVAINNGEEEWNNQAMIFSSAQRFADSGAKLIRLEFPGTEIPYLFHALITLVQLLTGIHLNALRLSIIVWLTFTCA
jgi:hypothetical protein